MNGKNFTTKEQCAELDPSDVSEEHDLRFLRENGFDPAPAVYIKQYFATSADGTSELVITYGKRVANCKSEVVTADFKAKLDQESRTVVEVVSMNR